MSIKISYIHTFPALVQVFEELTAEYLPGASASHATESAFFHAEFGRGYLSASEEELLVRYAQLAEASGSDAIVATCSFLGTSVDKLRDRVGIPWIRVDEEMGQRAIRMGGRIGVLATAQSSLAATESLLRRIGAEESSNARIDARLCEGAFEQLSAGDRTSHDLNVSKNLLALQDDVDVVVLSQASMARVLEPMGSALTKPVLTSPTLCMEWLAANIEPRSE